MSQKRGVKYEEEMELRRGPWTLEEDSLLIHYIASHGEGRWNLLAKFSGLKRTGKSCRLRWLNYLKPDVRRGNLSPEEQYLILELHSKWGNRWSRIAQQLPGRTDNEIKNYWRTRVQRQARQLKIDTNSSIFRDAVRRYWMPRLLQKMGSSATLQSVDYRNTVAIPAIVTTNNSSVTNNFDQATNAPPLPLPLPPPPPSKSFDPGIQQAFDNSAYYEPPGSENWNSKFSEFSSSPPDDFANTNLSFSQLLDGQINVGRTYNVDVVELASTSASTSECNSYDQNCVGGGGVENLWGLDELWHARKLHEWSGI